MTKLMVKNKLIFVIFAVLAFVVFLAGKALADCEPNYGGGETCTFKKHFDIEKYVRLEGDESWKNEVTVDLDDSDEADKLIEFKIVVKASVRDADGVDVNSITFDDMKMSDKWPDELKFLSKESEDELTEKWDSFKPGETKTFYITGKIKDSEKEDVDSEKCVVNTARLYQNDDRIDSDDATVCYTQGGEVLGAISELPATGNLSVLGIAGVGLILLGAFLRGKKAIK
jgi:hypothetical protein